MLNSEINPSSCAGVRGLPSNWVSIRLVIPFRNQVELNCNRSVMLLSKPTWVVEEDSACRDGLPMIW